PVYFDFEYIPQSNPGAKQPKHEGERCFGTDLRQTEVLQKINLNWLIEAYQHTAHPNQFSNAFFTKLAGTAQLRRQIEKGMDAEEIRDTWKTGLKEYDQMRQPYLLYP